MLQSSCNICAVIVKQWFFVTIWQRLSFPKMLCNNFSAINMRFTPCNQKNCCFVLLVDKFLYVCLFCRQHLCPIEQAINESQSAKVVFGRSAFLFSFSLFLSFNSPILLGHNDTFTKYVNSLNSFIWFLFGCRVPFDHSDGSNVSMFRCGVGFESVNFTWFFHFWFAGFFFIIVLLYISRTWWPLMMACAHIHTFRLGWIM